MQPDGHQIRGFRQEVGLKRSTFAPLCYISTAHLAGIENGYHSVSVEVLHRILCQLNSARVTQGHPRIGMADLLPVRERAAS